jgi:hypothetical protein
MYNEQLTISIMKIRFLILLIVTVANVSAAVNDSLFARIKGDWASGQWISIMKAGRSPKDAMKKALNNIILSFEKEDDHYNIQLMHNGGHEGDERSFSSIVEITPYEYTLVECQRSIDEYGKNVIDTTLVGSLIFTANRNKAYFNIGMSMFSVNDTMVKLRPSLTSFVNDNTICGNYQDNMGRTYKFYPDGNVDWGGVKYKYWVQLDYVLERNDIFYIDKGENIREWLIFEKKGGTLYLYQTMASLENEGFSKTGKPLVLNPVKK